MRAIPQDFLLKVVHRALYNFYPGVHTWKSETPSREMRELRIAPFFGEPLRTESRVGRRPLSLTIDRARLGLTFTPLHLMRWYAG